MGIPEFSYPSWLRRGVSVLILSDPFTIEELFFNEFIGTTNNADLTHLIHLSRCMLYGIHAIYPPYEVTQHGGSDLVSEKKLIKGDGTWAYKK